MKKLFLFAVLAHSYCFAQTTIEGYVEDIMGTPQPNTIIYIENTFAETESDSTGYFKLELSAQHTGKVTLIAHLSGYEDEHVRIDLDRRKKMVQVTFKYKINALDEVVVNSKELKEIDFGNSQEIREMEIFSIAPDASLITALSSTTGGQQVGETGELSVRGGEGRETNYFFDGMIVKNQLGASLQNQAGGFRFSPNLFGKMELISGGFSAEYGNALSSILLMESKDVAQAKNLDIFISPFFADLETSIPINEDQSIEFKASATDFGMFSNVIKPSLKYMQLEKGPQSFDGTLFYKLKLKNNGYFKFFSYGSSSTIISNEQTIDNSTIENNIKNLYTYNLATLHYYLNNKNKLHIGVSSTRNEDNLEQNEFQTETFTTLKSQNDNFHIKATLNTEISNSISLKSGIEYFNEHTVFEIDQDETQLSNELVAGFTEGKIKIVNNLYSTIGVRLDHSRLSDQTRAALRYNIKYENKKKFTLGFSYGNFYQQDSDLNLLRNPDLNLLSANHYILYVLKKMDNRILKIDLYNKEYNVLTLNEPAGGRNSNGYGYARGVDILWKDEKTFGNYKYRTNFSYIDAQRRYANYPIEAPFHLASKFKFSFTVNRLFLNGSLITSVNYNYLSGRPYFNPNLDDKAYNSNTTKDNHKVSTNIMYSFKIKNTPILLVGTVDNILGSPQIYNYTYSSSDLSQRRAIQPLYNRFIFLGCFISLGLDKTEQLIDEILNN